MPDKTTPLHIVWFRRDLRLSDHAALWAAAKDGAQVLPVFIGDDQVLPRGAAARWRFGEGLACFQNALAARGLPLILRRGDPVKELLNLCAETGATEVHWIRRYDPTGIACDTEVKSRLGDAGVRAVSHAGNTLLEPWVLKTKTGGHYKVFSPFWRAMQEHCVEGSAPTPDDLRPPQSVPSSEVLEDWALGRAMFRGAEVVAGHTCIGEQAARARLDRFIEERMHRYSGARDRLDLSITSGLSENLTYGEISPKQVWNALAPLVDEDKEALKVMRQLAWRDFAWSLTYNDPHLLEANWRDGWDDFPWATEGEAITRWQRGMTGVDVVDAAMRELYVTGTMHNRARMIVASYLCKHLLIHWKIGANWFADTLIDWDPAINAVSWQWVAGCGPDAAPYFRIFNPDSQAEKFDPDQRYRSHYLQCEGASAFRKAVPLSWGQDFGKTRPKPLIGLKEGRERALEAYESIRSS